MAGVELATAYISIIPQIKGMDQAIKKSVGGVSATLDKEMGDLGKVGTSKGKSLGGGIAKGMGLALGGGLAAVGAMGATALAKGFGRLKSIDDAQGKLTGLGHSAKTVDNIMANALESVKGTAFGLDEAAATAAGTVAAGIKPGKDLTNVLKLVADTATIAGTDMGSMGAIFNKVASSNKIQGDVIAQLGDRGIPIIQFLAKELGVTAGEVTDLASKGKIDFKTFRSAMEDGLGGAAQASGKTFTGAMKNAGAALGRLGANVLSGVFPQMKGVFGGLTATLDSMGPAAEKFGVKLGGAFKQVASFGSGAFKEATGGVKALVAAFKAGGDDVTSSGFAGALERVGLVARKAFDLLGPHIKTFGEQMAGLKPTIVSLANTIGPFLQAAFQAALPYIKIAAGIIGGAFIVALKVIPPVLKGIMKAIEGVLNFLKPLLPVITAVGVAWLTYTGITKGVAIAQGMVKAAAIGTRIGLAALTVQTWAAAAATKAMAVASKIAAGAQKIWTGIQWAWNAAASANPLALVVIAIVALVAAIVIAYKKSDKFRAIVDAAFAGIKKAIGAVVDWFKNTAWPTMQSVFGWIGDKASALGGFFVKAGKVIAKAFSVLFKVLTFPFKAAYVFWDIVIHALVFAFKWVVKQIKSIWNKIVGVLKVPIRTAVDWVKTKIDQMRLGFHIVRGKIKAIWDKALEIVRKPIRKAVDWVKTKIDQMRLGFNITRAKIKAIWDKALEIVKKPIREGVDWVKRKIDQMRVGFTVIRGKIKTAWSKIQEIVRKPIRDGVDWVKRKADQMRTKFNDVRDGIGRGWAKLKAKLKSPITGAVRWINTSFIGTPDGKGINYMLKKIGTDYKVPHIPGFDRGGYTGPGGKYTPAGLVHADEFVLKKEATNKLRRQIGLDGLNYMNTTGRLPELGEYASGGIVALGRRLQRMGFQVGEHPAFGGVAPVHSPNSFHYKASALDINADYGRAAQKYGGERAALNWLHGYLNQLGWRTIWQYPNHYDHLHVDTGSGPSMGKPGRGGTGDKSGGNFFGGLFSSVKDAIGGLADKGKELLSKVPGSGMIPPMVKGLGGKIMEGVKAKAKGLLENLNPFGDDFTPASTMSLGSIAGIPNRALGKRMAAAKYGWTGDQWTALSRLWEKESSWNHLARNPSSGAYGIPQALPGSKMRSSGSDWRTNPRTQIDWGLKYIKGRYGNPATAWMHSVLRNWYANGGMVKALEFDSGGWLPTGRSMVVNNTGKPEPLQRMNLKHERSSEDRNITVLVQNPWTGKYHEAKMQEVIDEDSDFQRSTNRMNGK